MATNRTPDKMSVDELVENIIRFQSKSSLKMGFNEHGRLWATFGFVTVFDDNVQKTLAKLLLRVREATQ